MSGVYDLCWGICLASRFEDPMAEIETYANAGLHVDPMGDKRLDQLAMPGHKLREP